MRSCANCGAAVSVAYWRVFNIDGRVEVCPHCEDRSVKAHLRDEYATR